MKNFKILKYAFMALLLFGLFPPDIFAATPISLRDLLAEAMSNNPELRALKERYGARLARVYYEGALDDPALKVEMEDLASKKPYNNGPGNAMQTRYTLSQMFPFPGKRSAKEKIAEKEALVSKAEFESKAVEIAYMVKEAYYAYAYASLAIKINGEVKELLSYISSIVQSRYSVGQALQQDVIKAQFEAAMLTNELIALTAERDGMEERLKALLDRHADLPLGEPALPKLEKADASAYAFTNASGALNPEIKAVEYELQASEMSVDLAKRNYYPDFMVGVAPVQRDGRFDTYDFMFQINIPLWRSKYDSQTKEAISNAGSARLRLSAQRNKKAFEIKEALLKVSAAYKTAELYETSLVPQAEMSFESALKGYQSGKSDFLTLLDTGRSLKKTKIERAGSFMDYKKKLAMLEKAVGAELDNKEGAR
ncbi:TolC family protein [bacterium]|nr:MAG: TolC family protein [bacterium]